jgi:hypothetical protein
MIDEIKIMQYADGMLPIEEKEEVEKAIQDNPEYKKLLKDYQETGDLLFKLGAEIKSQPLPDSLKEKLKVIKSWKKTPKETKISFNFFSLFKMQYAGIAAAFAIFFAGGFYTHTMIMTKKGSQGTMQAVTKKMDIESKKLEFRSATDQNLDLSERVTNIYKYFEEEKFIDEISPLLSDLTENQEFTLSLKDNNGKIIKFVLVENFNSNNSVCKKIRFNEPLRMSNIDEGTEVTLDLCKVNENYELSSINISK